MPVLSRSSPWNVMLVYLLIESFILNGYKWANFIFGDSTMSFAWKLKKTAFPTYRQGTVLCSCNVSTGASGYTSISSGCRFVHIWSGFDMPTIVPHEILMESKWSILFYDILCKYTCPLLLGGGGPTCRFTTMFWGGWTPPGLCFEKVDAPRGLCFEKVAPKKTPQTIR